MDAERIARLDREGLNLLIAPTALVLLSGVAYAITGWLPISPFGFGVAWAIHAIAVVIGRSIALRRIRRSAQMGDPLVSVISWTRYPNGTSATTVERAPSAPAVARFEVVDRTDRRALAAWKRDDRDYAVVVDPDEIGFTDGASDCRCIDGRCACTSDSIDTDLQNDR